MAAIRKWPRGRFPSSSKEMKLISKLLLFTWLLSVANSCHAQQKATIHAVLNNNVASSAPELIFDLTITNREYKSVYVHNTAFIKQYASTPTKSPSASR